MPASRGPILATPGLHWAPFAPNFDPILVHASFTGTSLGPFELHSCPRGMSRGKQSQQHWARGQSQHEFAVSCCRDFAEISAERKHCCHMARIVAVPIFGTPKPGKQALFCAMFWDVNNWLPYTPVGAESDAIAIRMGTPASRWVLNGTQVRSE